MLRITVTGAGDEGRAVKLDGKLVGPWVDELERVCREMRTEMGLLTIDLAAVSFVDLRGTHLLRELEIAKVRLTNCTPFVAEQLRGEMAC